MPPDAPPAEFVPYWRETLATNDRAAHAAEAARSDALEAEGLRHRCADLEAALAQARAGIAVRHDLLAAQSAAIEERDRRLADVRAELAAAQAELAGAQAEAVAARETTERIVGSRRWQALDKLSPVLGAGRRAVRGARRAGTAARRAGGASRRLVGRLRGRS
ncbi:hypothetical protein MF406_05805 [Georgenia sp. TF02-10]|uniref:hypothetical protein n=1 Tax=Georgenia sp. TF02-10 TaxID=2917725 RepID=UPI001FA793E0|nr:hypothetical protein [Georgenia sp. TF02-10]UNX55751.1 hypothetical protein MF406_05805 [Georgenia sp. TF02-10]